MAYDLADDLLKPLTFVVLAMVVVTLVALRRRERTGRWLAIATVALVTVSHPLTARVLVGWLERDQPPASALPADVPVIVVLSGSMRPGPDGMAVLAEDSLERTLHAASLYRRLGRRRIVATGGPSRAVPGGGPIAARMRDLLEDLGVDPRDVLVEGRSRSTYENALFTWRLLQPMGINRILLVTEAIHMPRSVRAFRAQGFDVVPAGCCYSTLDPFEIRHSFLPSAKAALGVQRAAHELLGLVWYRFRGHIR